MGQAGIILICKINVREKPSWRWVISRHGGSPTLTLVRIATGLLVNRDF
jgi:hypothetical protein